MKISAVVKPAMLFAAGSAATAAGAAPVVDATGYVATSGGTQIRLANSTTSQYVFSIDPGVKNTPIGPFAANFYNLTGLNGATVTSVGVLQPELLQTLPAESYGSSVRTGIEFGEGATQYYGLRFSANGNSYAGYAEVTGSGSRINSITYDLVGASVPEPASWALMIAGFGGVGLAMRRRRRQVPAPVVA